MRNSSDTDNNAKDRAVTLIRKKIYMKHVSEGEDDCFRFTDEQWIRLSSAGLYRQLRLTNCCKKHFPALKQIPALNAEHICQMAPYPSSPSLLECIAEQPDKVQAIGLTGEHICELTKIRYGKKILKSIIENHDKITTAALKGKSGNVIDYICQLMTIKKGCEILQLILANPEIIKSANLQGEDVYELLAKTKGTAYSRMKSIFPRIKQPSKNKSSKPSKKRNRKTAHRNKAPHKKSKMTEGKQPAVQTVIVQAVTVQTTTQPIPTNGRLSHKNAASRINQSINKAHSPLTQFHARFFGSALLEKDEYWTGLHASHDEMKSYIKARLAKQEQSVSQSAEISLYNWRWDLQNPKSLVKLKKDITTNQLSSKNNRFGIIVFNNDHYTSLVIRTSTKQSNRFFPTTQINAIYMDSLGQSYSLEAAKEIQRLLNKTVFPNHRIEITNQSLDQQLTGSDCAYIAAQNMLHLLTKEDTLPAYRDSTDFNAQKVITLRKAFFNCRRDDIRLLQESLIRRLAEMRTIIEHKSMVSFLEDSINKAFRAHRNLLSQFFSTTKSDDVEWMKTTGINLLLSDYFETRENYLSIAFPKGNSLGTINNPYSLTT